MRRWIFLICTLALWVLIFTATFVGLAPHTAEVRAALGCFLCRADQCLLSSQRVLGKPLIAEMHARGEQLDEFIRRFQRYKPKIEFEPGTPQVSLSFFAVLTPTASRVLTCRGASAHCDCSLCSTWCRRGRAIGSRAWPRRSALRAVPPPGSCSRHWAAQHKRGITSHRRMNKLKHEYLSIQSTSLALRLVVQASAIRSQLASIPTLALAQA